MSLTTKVLQTNYRKIIDEKKEDKKADKNKRLILIHCQCKKVLCYHLTICFYL